MTYPEYSRAAAALVNSRQFQSLSKNVRDILIEKLGTPSVNDKETNYEAILNEVRLSLEENPMYVDKQAHW